MEPTQSATAAAQQSGDGVADPEKTYTHSELSAIMAKERKSWERKYAGASQEERDELDRLRTDQKAREQRDAEAKGEWDRLKKSMAEEHQKALTDREQRIEKATGALKVERIRRALVSAAAKANAIDPEEVADLLERRCRLTEDFQVEVLDEAGQRAYRGGNELTPSELVEQYLTKKLHLVKAGTFGQGGGSKGGATVTEGLRLTPELQGAKQALADAEKLAKSGMPQDLARAQTAFRRVRELERAAAGQ